jgi:hypothetical protein
MGSAAEKAQECSTPRIAPKNAPLESGMLLTIRADPSYPCQSVFYSRGRERMMSSKTIASFLRFARRLETQSGCMSSPMGFERMSGMPSRLCSPFVR